MKNNAPSRMWVGVTLTALLWATFYAVRMHEGRFGTWSEITFMAAISGGGLSYLLYLRR